jgi:hypothetical protein
MFVMSSSVRGMKCRRTIFDAQVGPVRIPQKTRWDMLRQTCVLTSSGVCGSHNAFRSVRGVKCRHIIFHSRVRSVRIPQKACQDTLRRTCVFASSRICGPHSAFWCIWDAKRRCTIFYAWVGQYGFHKKRTGAHCTELVFLHLVGYVDHVVHSVV